MQAKADALRSKSRSGNEPGLKHVALWLDEAPSIDHAPSPLRRRLQRAVFERICYPSVTGNALRPISALTWVAAKRRKSARGSCQPCNTPAVRASLTEGRDVLTDAHAPRAYVSSAASLAAVTFEAAAESPLSKTSVTPSSPSRLASATRAKTFTGVSATAPVASVSRTESR